MNQISIYSFCLFLVFWTTHGYAQEKIKEKKPRAVQLTYHGHFTLHPGMSFGYQQFLQTKTREKDKKKYTRQNRKNWIWESDIFTYIHPRNHTAFGVNTGIIYRVVKKKGGFWEIGLKTGALRTVNAGQTFTVENNAVRELRFAGNTYATTTFSVGLGKDLRRRKGKPYAWFVRPGWGIQFPYNNFIAPILQFEFGVSHFLGQKQDM